MKFFNDTKFLATTATITKKLQIYFNYWCNSNYFFELTVLREHEWIKIAIFAIAEIKTKKHYMLYCLHFMKYYSDNG